VHISGGVHPPQFKNPRQPSEGVPQSKSTPHCFFVQGPPPPPLKIAPQLHKALHSAGVFLLKKFLHKLSKLSVASLTFPSLFASKLVILILVKVLSHLFLIKSAHPSFLAFSMLVPALNGFQPEK
jgi:hypothetical protein